MGDHHSTLILPCRHKPRRAFTLLELLVCIAIITILIAIILPIANRSLMCARQAGCQNNLRQLMLAFRGFAQDHEDQLPGGYWDLREQTDPNPDHWDWLRGNSSQWTSAPQGGTLYRYVNHCDSIYRCPALDINAPAMHAMIGPRCGSNGQYDYVSMLDFTGARITNIHFLSQLTYPDGHFEFLPTPVIVEGDPVLLNGFEMKSWHSGTDSMGHTHRGGAYYAAIDGSVQWLNEPPGGCWMWQSQSTYGKWVSLGPEPFFWGQWNRQ